MKEMILKIRLMDKEKRIKKYPNNYLMYEISINDFEDYYFIYPHTEIGVLIDKFKEDNNLL